MWKRGMRTRTPQEARAEGQCPAVCVCVYMCVVSAQSQGAIPECWAQMGGWCGNPHPTFILNT